MPTFAVEHRQHRRVAFFLVPSQRELVPVWVFKPADVLQSLAGLVLNLSEGGVQVLTGPDDAPDGCVYELQLLLGEADSVPRFRARVTRAWTQEAASSGWVSGLRFIDEHSSAEVFIRSWRESVPERGWVRCVLVEGE